MTHMTLEVVNKLGGTVDIQGWKGLDQLGSQGEYFEVTATFPSNVDLDKSGKAASVWKMPLLLESHISSDYFQQFYPGVPVKRHDSVYKS